MNRTYISFTPWMDLMANLHLEAYVERNRTVMTVRESVEWFLQIMAFNEICPRKFVTDVYEIIERIIPKKNALFLFGAPARGKSLILNSLVDSAVFPLKQDAPYPGQARFHYAAMAPARVALCNDFKIHSNVADKMLLLLEGADVIDNGELY